MSHHILIIEDDTFLRDLYNEMLTDNGFEVDTAVDGEEGLSKISTNEYNLVLLDIMMPKKDGLQVLRDIPKEKREVPVVMFTNLGQDQVIKDALAAGASGYLIKSSLDPDQVLSKVKEFMKTKE